MLACFSRSFIPPETLLKKLEPLQEDPIKAYDAIAMKKNEPRRAVLVALSVIVKEAFKKYRQSASNLESLLPTVSESRIKQQHQC